MPAANAREANGLRMQKTRGNRRERRSIRSYRTDRPGLRCRPGPAQPLLLPSRSTVGGFVHERIRNRTLNSVFQESVLEARLQWPLAYLDAACTRPTFARQVAHPHGTACCACTFPARAWVHRAPSCPECRRSPAPLYGAAP